MNCPKCKTIDLRKRGFDSPFNCHKYGGMWLESEKIPKFIESSGNVEIVDSGEGLNDDKTGICPEGHGIMIRAKIDIEEPFLKVFWCKSWQNRQRKQKSRANYLERNRRLLGDNVFEEIMKLSEVLKDHPEKGRAVALLQQEIIKNIH